MNAASSRRQLAPARPGWRRLSLLTVVLLTGWALATPTGQPPRWWHLIAGAAVAVGFLGSWHGQHLSTTAGRRAAMILGNYQRTHHHGHRPADHAAHLDDPLAAPIVIRLRPQPHGLTTAADNGDQLPWQFITAWLHRYGVHADTLTVCAVTTTPPASSLRRDVAHLLTGPTPQHRDTWISYTLRAQPNVAALTARQTDIGSLAATTARRLVAELREQGWLATVCEDLSQLPQFVEPAATVRRECWTGVEYSDGWRAVYAIDPRRLRATLSALSALASKTTWVAVTVRAAGPQPPTIQAAAAALTAARPAQRLLPGTAGLHGLHRRAVGGVAVTGFDAAAQFPRAALDEVAGDPPPWHTTGAGVPIGSNRAGQAVYLGLTSPERVRITVTGSPEFHVGIASRLALSGWPMAVYAADLRPWGALANYAGPQQVLLAPHTVLPGSIVVSDLNAGAVPAGAIAVALRHPQASPAPQTGVVITQDPRRPALFRITTPHGNEMLSTQL